jgi:hypothetical protein
MRHDAPVLDATTSDDAPRLPGPHLERRGDDSVPRPKRATTSFGGLFERG